MLNKDLQKGIEFMIESKPNLTDFTPVETKPISFVITPDSLQNVKDVIISKLILQKKLIFFRLFDFFFS